MELENQVVSLELAKRLKELGVKQDSICQLVRFSDRPDGTEHYVLDMLCRMGQNGNETYSAFTVAELGRYMPTTYLGDLVSLIPNKTVGGYWRVDLDDEGMLCSETTEADARAKLLIYLLENNLIEIKAGHIFYGKVVIISNK
jgi:hypothetical protein